MLDGFGGFVPLTAFDTKEEAINYANSYVDESEFAYSIFVFDMWAAPTNKAAIREIYRRSL